MLRRLHIENLVLIRRADLVFHPGVNAVTGETGAGKTIFTQAIGLLLGAKGDSTAVGPAGSEAYVEAELAVPADFFDDDDLAPLRDLKPDDEIDLVLARRVFADGRTRAYAWGRSVNRGDLAAAAERLVQMSGQFEQRRLALPSYQLDVIDTFCGDDQLARRRDARVAWRELAAARRRFDELSRDADAAAARLRRAEELVEDSDGIGEDEEESLRVERERLRHTVELGASAHAALAALAPDDGDGAAGLVGAAGRALGPVVAYAPELSAAASELRDVELRLGEIVGDLHRFTSGLTSEPDRLEQVEARLDEIATVRRRYACATTEELLLRRSEALAELERVAGGRDPVEAAAEDVAEAERRSDQLARALRATRTAAAAGFGEAVTRELRSLGMGDAELCVEIRERELGPGGRDDVSFLVRVNQGLPFLPVAETASGGELSRIALAIAAVGGGGTMVFDEVDTGIGGVTAHRIAEALQRLAAGGQVVVITHLPQVASVADRHFLVEKVPGDPTHARIGELDAADRRHELERMLGGGDFVTAVSGGPAA